jgi:hypothetical protein
MHNMKILVPPTIALLCSLLASAAPAQESLSASAKKIFHEKQESVIWVSAVAKVSFSAEGGKELPYNPPDQETKVEALATIVDPAGLVVAALSQVDPARGVSGREIRMGNTTVKIEAVATLKEVKVITPDGSEIPAEIVMKDADLDLAFIRAKTASKEAKGVVFKALDLKASGVGQVGDDAVTLSRMDEVLNRAPVVTRGQITAMTKRPRQFLRVSGAVQGCPTFLMDGRLLGIAVTRTVKNKSSQTVVIPAADVLDIAEQAKTAQPAAEKEVKAKEDKAGKEEK